MRVKTILDVEPDVPEKGLCDDLFLSVMKFEYLLLTQGWGAGGRETELDSLEVTIDDEYCSQIFELWVNMLVNAYDVRFAKINIESRVSYILSNGGLSQKQVFRLNVMKELVILGFIESLETATGNFRMMLDLAVTVCSTICYSKCFEMMRSFDVFLGVTCGDKA